MLAAGLYGAGREHAAAGAAAGIPDVGLKGTSGPATGIDRPCTESSAVEDASGLTFEEWDPTKDADDSQPPAPMIINSSEFRGADFNLQEVIPPDLESALRLGRCTRGVASA